MAKRNPIEARTKLEMKAGAAALKQHLIKETKRVRRAASAPVVTAADEPLPVRAQDYLIDPMVRLPHDVRRTIARANAYFHQTSLEDFVSRLEEMSWLRIAQPDGPTGPERQIRAQTIVDSLRGLAALLS